MQLSLYHSVYFIGIGGIGMSALARWFKLKGMKVAGYDRTETVLTQQLKAEGIDIHFEDRTDLIPSFVKKEETLVVYTPAVPKGHKELNYLMNNQFTVIKRSECLGLITKDYKTVAVAGTHGKTTTSSIVAHILRTARKNMVAFLGGITTNYNSNLVMYGEVNADTIVVVEADEFDRSFLKLHPTLAVVTSTDADHLDIYKDHESLLQSFADFISQIKKDGYLAIHESVEETAEHNQHITTESYGMSRGQFFAGRITARGGFFEFDLKGLREINNIQLGVPGFHNMQNAMAAIAIALRLGIDENVIKEALASFSGVKRRFEFIINDENLVYIDDYAHHPREIEAFIGSLKEMYAGKKITVVFQPHLFTRTRDFADGFAASLSLADELLMMDIYPAREEPIPGVDADLIFKKIKGPSKMKCTKKNVVQKLKDLNIEVLATVGAGDIDTCVAPIKEFLTKKYHEV
ncbi:MAG: UDP-N-acetylmuramate--L-alanine ligase [Flammeovirgaceae bacterium]|nr:UDP-N-acetylmuramate--L-alanine ligase [Flammeovirgaceae bacterium]